MNRYFNGHPFESKDDPDGMIVTEGVRAAK
jgi:hypothetical protein